MGFIGASGGNSNNLLTQMIEVNQDGFKGIEDKIILNTESLEKIKEILLDTKDILLESKETLSNILLELKKLTSIDDVFVEVFRLSFEDEGVATDLMKNGSSGNNLIVQPGYLSFSANWLRATETGAECVLNGILYKAGYGNHTLNGLPIYDVIKGSKITNELKISVGEKAFIEVIVLRKKNTE